MARQIEAYKLRTELAVDATKGTAAMKSFQKDVDNVGASFKKLGPQIDASLKGKEAGLKFGKNFSNAATAVITGSIDELGKTIGSIIGTAVLPGIGTAVGSTVGDAVQTGLEKASGPILRMIKQGMELNKVLESTKVEFTAFTGSAEEADKYLNKLLETSKQTGILPQNLIEASESLYDLTQNLKLTDTILRASIEQAADIGGGEEQVRKLADALGLLAEKGDLSAAALRPLYKLKLDPLQRLSEGLGLSVEKVKQLAAAGRISGAGAARIISESVLREKQGFAARLAGTTTEGAERLFAARSAVVAAKGTAAGTQRYGQAMRRASDTLVGPGAEQAAQYLNDKLASVFNMVEGGISSGMKFVEGVGKGLTGSEAATAIEGAVNKLQDIFTGVVGKVFKMNSPSEWMADEVGVPMGQGIAIGIIPGFADTLEKVTGPALKQKIDEWIKQYAEQFKVPENLIRTVMKLETGHLPLEKAVRARSPKNARGLMQVVPATGARYGASNLYDPQQNISAGTQYLRFLMDTFGAGNQHLVLGGYNAGENAVKKYGNQVPPYAETQGYVKRGMAMLGQGGAGVPTSATVAPSAQQADATVATWLKIMRELTPEERKAINDLGATIQRTMKELGQTEEQLRNARAGIGKDPGTGREFEKGVTGQTKQALVVQSLEEKSKKLREALAGLSVENDRLINFTVAMHVQDAAALKTKQDNYQTLIKSMPVARDLDEIMNHLGTDTMAKLPEVAKDSVEAIDLTSASLYDFTIGFPPLMKGMEGVAVETEKITALTKEQQAAYRKMYVQGTSMLTTLSGALNQVAGQVPSESNVGKKRGMFSKILGIAAPFLSFIPGVGPILSTIAGAASQGLAGNWGGAISAAAGGFAPGGAFRSTSRGTSTPVGGIAHDTTSETTLAAMGTLIPKRAGGGPVYAGSNYLVGEHGAELFSPGLNGQVAAAGTPMPVEVTNWPGGSGGGGGMSTATKFLGGGLAGVLGGKNFMAGGLVGAMLGKMRARGGPVYRGERYIVGEGGAEMFTPAADGYITPHGMSVAGGGAGGAGAILAAAAELRAAVAHLNSMPASHVVMRGAHGLVSAMDRDAGLIRLVSQRQRLA